MSVLNDGRNEVNRVSNSDGRCLLENWFEERQVKHLDPACAEDKVTLLKNGNTGILSTNFDASISEKTEVRENYKAPAYPGVRGVGKKQEMFERMLWEKYGSKEIEDFYAPPEKTDFRSVKMVDYDKPEFEEKMGQLPPPTKTHDYMYEQPVTFWTELQDRATGVSSVKTGDTAFRKNTAFSKPIDEHWDQTKPYDLENYPKM